MTIHKSPLADLALRDISITERVLQGLQAVPDRVLAVDGPSGASLTGAEMVAAITELAGGLQRIGVAPGVVVALLAPNCAMRGPRCW